MERQAKILLVDDEPDIIEILQYNLRKEGYHVITSANGKEGLLKAIKEIPDLIILDIMMPEMDGIETCRQLREHHELRNAVIVFLSARSEEYSQIAGFDVGADDYIVKPIKPRMFVSRVKALLRRSNIEPESFTSLESVLGNIRIDRDRYVVIKDEKEIYLPRKEFELFSLIISKPGKVFKRDEIIAHVWGNDIVVGHRTIDVHIRKIREKLGDDSIKTIKGVGYKFDQ